MRSPACLAALQGGQARRGPGGNRLRGKFGAADFMLAVRWHVGVTGGHVAQTASDGASGLGAVIGPHRGRRARRRPYLAVRPVRRALHRVMRQRVRRQCCTRGRTRPAHPRQLAGVLMGDEPARRFLCARCRAPTLVCSRCDRGQIYCAAGCAGAVRQQSQRDAGRRYQGSLRGRFRHAARTRRWRERQALLSVSQGSSVARSATQSVTHQGSLLSASDAVLAVPSPMPAEATPAPASTAQSCKTITTGSASSPAATLSAWRCHWCHRPCAARVRLDFLRHSPAARRASARGEPSRGHSP